MSKNPTTISHNGRFTRRSCTVLVLLIVGGLIAKLPFTDTVVRAAASFLTSVAHNATLAGDGTTASPLGIANNGVGTNQIANDAVTAPKIAAGQVVKSINGLSDGITLAAGSNVSLQLTGQTLTIASMLGLTSVAHDATLAGNGTSLSPLTIPEGAITTEHIFSGQVVKELNSLKDSITLVGGPNITITPSGNNTLTIAASVPSQPFINPKQVALLQWYEANQTNINFSLPTTPAATHSMCFDGTHLWITDQHTSSVTKIRASDGAVLGTFPTGGLGAYGIAFDGSRIWVGNQGRISRLRASDGALLGTINFPNGAGDGTGVAFDGLHIWVVGATTGHVYKIRATDGALLGDFNYTGSGVFLVNRLAFDGTSIWVTNTNPDRILKIRPSDGALLGMFTVGTSPIDVAFDGSNVWAANAGSNSVTKLRASDGAVVGTFNVGTTPVGITFDGRSIWVANFGSNNVTKLRASDGSNLGTFNVGTVPRAISFDGANVYILNQSDNTISKL